MYVIHNKPLWCLFFVVILQVTFIGKLGVGRDKSQVFVGTFYGCPIVPPDHFSPIHLHSLEESILSHYHTSREKLTSSLLTYSNHLQRSLASSSTLLEKCKEEVNGYYQECFKAQVQLARLRHWRKSQEDTRPLDKQYSIEKLASSVDMATLPISQLTKLIGCIVDSLLVLSKSSSTSNDQKETKPSEEVEKDGEDVCVPLSEEDCCMLFSSLCVHGTPKFHARACALLIRLCGSQSWWGHFVTSTAMDLLSGSNTAVFNQDRSVTCYLSHSKLTHETSA